MAISEEAENKIEYVTVTIANGAALSDAAYLHGGMLLKIIMPAAWTAAGLSFQESVGGTTYGDVYEEASVATERVLAAAASQVIVLEPQHWGAVDYIKVRSGTTGVPVNQGAARTITLVVLR